MKSSPLAFIHLMRPLQWIKNGFVFVGLFLGHRWGDATLVADVLVAFLSFSLMSSAVYVFNDLLDLRMDRLHWLKKKRPLASGRVSKLSASVFSLLLATTALLLAFSVSKIALYIIAGYAALNVAYSIVLKRVVILDVFCIAAGLMLRILIGTLGVGIPLSNWLLLCGLMFTLFLGFAKRREELMTSTKKRGKYRSVLDHYSAPLLDQITVICAAGVIITYSLYTTSERAFQVHNTNNLIFTVPYLVYGLFRYLFLVHERDGEGEAGQNIIKDPHILLAMIGWAVTTFALIGF